MEAVALKLILFQLNPFGLNGSIWIFNGPHVDFITYFYAFIHFAA